LGRVDDVLPYLYASDVYIMPSSIEGFGVAAVEAMGTGLPSILSNRPALYDFKNDSDNIVFIEPTANDIAQAMQNFINMGKSELKDKGKLISEVIIAKYGLENGAAKHAKLYRSFID
jgi:glycosyltransferase involved in cell wall biosynthesis